MKEDLSVRERFILAICEMNRREKKIQIIKKWKIGRLEITFTWRSKKNLWGRFGGGWNWELGFQGSGRSWIIMLLICSVRFHVPKKVTT